MSKQNDKYNSQNLLKSKDLKWLLIDFDKTIAQQASGPNYTPGDPMPGVQEALKELQDMGYKIVVFTARHWADVIVVEKYCEDHDIPYNKVICGKPLGVLLIDDKGFHLTDWKKDLPKIKERLEK